MVKMVEPPYAKLSMEITLNYSPKDEEIAAWHIVKDGQKENFQTIATKHGVPVARLRQLAKNIPVNFGSVPEYL